MSQRKSDPSRILRFTNLKLASWKNFKAADVRLGERTFIIGPNASGKSNLLEVFRFLHDLAADGGGLAKAVALREGMSKVRSLHATSNSAVNITVEMLSACGEKWTYALTFDTLSAKSEQVLVSSETVLKDGQVVLQRPDQHDRIDSDRLRQTAIEQVSSNKLFRHLADFFRSIRFMNAVPQLIREGQISPGGYPGADPLGRDLLQHIRAAPKGERTRRLKAIARVLTRVVPDFRDLRLEQDEQGKPHLVVGFAHWRSQAARQRESQFSDGTLRLIAMLWSLQEAAGPLLLEEPEWSLHTEIVQRLAAFIASMQALSGGRQVLISTHSDRMLADPGIAADELLLITPAPKGGSMITPAARQAIIAKAMQQGRSAAETALPMTRMHTMPLFGRPA